LSENPISDVLCIGAGPAGLATAYELLKADKSVCVLEADPEYVGGIARTFRYKDFLFDIGGHRFFTKSREVEDFWHEILPNDFLTRERHSHIFYNNTFFPYPLDAWATLSRLGPWQTILCGLSYLRARLWPRRNVKSLADWTVNQFGQRLYDIFFRDYSAKLWGVPATSISADWAQQRINRLNLWQAVINALQGTHTNTAVKSLIKSFKYPRKGPGMFWEAAAAKIKQRGGIIHMGARVTGVEQQNDGTWLVTYQQSGETQQHSARHVVSSMPITELARHMTPPLASLPKAQRLQYRDFIVVALMVEGPDLFIDQWIYINDTDVKVGRIQNFKAWSPELVPDAKYNCYGLEYFCTEGDTFWQLPNDDLIATAKRELQTTLGISADTVFDACVVRQKKAYPVYTHDYQSIIAAIRIELEDRYPTLHLVGRNGMHRYNNQDHAIMSGLLTARNIAAERTVFNTWNINQDGEYLEQDEA